MKNQRSVFFCFLISGSVLAQVPYGDIWGNAGMQQVVETYFMPDTAMSRMKVSWAKMVLARDTMSAGITTRPISDVKCSNCRAYRFASHGEPVYVFDNSFSERQKFYKTQYGYNQELKPERELLYVKGDAMEEDTAYHMLSFTLTNYYKGFSIANTYQGSNFSNNPKTPPIGTETITYYDDGKIKMRKSVSHYEDNYTDSTTYSYPDKDTQVETYFLNGRKLWSTTRNFDPSTHQISAERSEALDDESRPYTHTINYTYDALHRLISVTDLMSKDRYEVRYDKNGLPLFVKETINGQTYVVLFYYSYYQ